MSLFAVGTRSVAPTGWLHEAIAAFGALWKGTFKVDLAAENDAVRTSLGIRGALSNRNRIASHGAGTASAQRLTGCELAIVQRIARGRRTIFASLHIIVAVAMRLGSWAHTVLNCNTSGLSIHAVAHGTTHLVTVRAQLAREGGAVRILAVEKRIAALLKAPRTGPWRRVARGLGIAELVSSLSVAGRISSAAFENAALTSTILTTISVPKRTGSAIQRASRCGEGVDRSTFASRDRPPRLDKVASVHIDGFVSVLHCGRKREGRLGDEVLGVGLQHNIARGGHIGRHDNLLAHLDAAVSRIFEYFSDPGTEIHGISSGHGRHVGHAALQANASNEGLVGGNFRAPRTDALLPVGMERRKREERKGL